MKLKWWRKPPYPLVMFAAWFCAKAYQWMEERVT